MANYKTNIASIRSALKNFWRTKLSVGACFNRSKPDVWEYSKSFVSPLSDDEVLENYPQFSDCLASWRNLANLIEYGGSVAWLVKQGFTLKEHAPKAGPCWKKLRYLQSWNFEDVPTENCLTFWVPRLAIDSTRQNIEQMKAHRAELKSCYSLPENHATSFGSIQLLFALILAYYIHTGERKPSDYFYTVSDTKVANHVLLIAGSFIHCLVCNSWVDNGPGDYNVGFFLLGVEKLQ